MENFKRPRQKNAGQEEQTDEGDSTYDLSPPPIEESSVVLPTSKIEESDIRLALSLSKIVLKSSEDSQVDAKSSLELYERISVIIQDQQDRRNKREIEERNQRLAERQFDQNERHHKDQMDFEEKKLALEARKQEDVEVQNEHTRDLETTDFYMKWGLAILAFLTGILFLVNGATIIAGPLIVGALALAARQVRKGNT